MDIGNIMGWALYTSGVFIVLAILYPLVARLCGWATRVIEDLEEGSHRNILERKVMEYLGFKLNTENGKWLIRRDDLKAFVIHGDYGYSSSTKEGYFMATCWVWACIGWVGILLSGLAVFLWKLTLPIVAFVAAVYLLRTMRRAQKLKASLVEAAPDLVAAELEARYPEKK